MWIAGLDALRKPLLHLHTQANRALPWADIDMDFMNLNQAAHGDREFGYIQSRLGVARKTVAGHASDPGVQPAGSAPGCGPRAAVAGMRSLRLARFGDNMRDVAVTEGDKVEAQLRFGVSVNTYGVNDLVAAGRRGRRRRGRRAGREYDEQLPGRRPELRPGGERHESLRYAARIEARPARVPRPTAGSARSPRTSRTSAACASCPGIAVQRLMADGYGFGGEGDWKTSVLLRTVKAMARRTSPAAPRSWRTTPTTSRRARSGSSARTCWRSARPSPRRSRVARSTRWASAAARTRSGWCSTPRPAPAVVVGMADLGDRFRLVANEIDVVPPDEPLPKLPVARAVWKPRPDFQVSTEAWLTAGGPHHTVLSHGRGHGGARSTSPRCRAPSCW